MTILPLFPFLLALYIVDKLRYKWTGKNAGYNKIKRMKEFLLCSRTLSLKP